MFRHLRRARQGHPRAIHQARVASRRLREALPVVPGSGEGRRRDSLLRDVRRIGRALGSVREIDVSLKELADRAKKGSLDPVAVTYLVDYLNEQRAERMHELEHKLERVDLRKLAAAIDELADGCEAGRATGWHTHLSARMRKKAKRLASELRSAGTMYAAEPMHDVRISAKKLRYSLELARAAAAAPVEADVKGLKRLQRLLGHLHDLQVLQLYAREAASASRNAALNTRLEAVQTELEHECRALHARYLAKVGVWTEIAERARLELATQIAVRRVARALKAGPEALRAVKRARTA
jgi:CHAD domain-containing protein